MTAMDLFVSKPVLRFEETAVTAKAASAQLDEDPESWPRQILTELFRTTPETSDFMPRVSMMKIDPEQGYGLGVILIENSTDSSLAAVRLSPSSKRVLIPVVVKSHILLPLDLIMLRTGRMLPLNGRTLREALFRPETFEMTTEDWGDTSLYNQFYPPGRSDNDFGAGIAQGIGGGTQGAVTFIQGPGMKLSAAEDYRLIRQLLPTILGPDLDTVGKLAASEPATLENTESAFFGALRLLAEAEKVATRDARELVKRAAASVAPDVIQMGWDPTENQYWVKMASRSSFMVPRRVYMGRGEALKFAGAEIVAKVDTEGTVTVSPSAAQTDHILLDASKWSVIEKPGIYKVKTVHGKEQVGWVIPNLIDLDGTFVPMAIFTNGATAMVQNQIVGAQVAAGVDLPSGPAKPNTTGCFYASGQGGVQATVPLKIEGRESGDTGESYLVRSITGEESRVRLVPGLDQIVVLKGEFHMPSTAKFMPLDDEAMVPLIDKVDQVTKTAMDMGVPAITLFAGDEDEVSVRFQAMPKLASVTNQRLTHEDAAFVLCLAGVPAKVAYEKIAEASSGPVQVLGTQDIRLASDLIEQTRKTASSRSHEVMALRRFLVKEASTLPDAMTVDAVLSLGFINSENVRMFISSIPYLEKCLSKICELVLASRLGLTEIPEFAATRAARALDEVIQGLKALALRDVEGDASAGN